MSSAIQGVLMKRKLLFVALLSIFAAVSISAQDAPAKPADTPKVTDFSGKWVLNVSKSQLNERMRIESMILTVEQTAKELKTRSEVKRTPPRDGFGGGGRGGPTGLAGSGPESRTFSLEGKETTEAPGEFEASIGMPGPKLKAEMKTDGTLDLSIMRKFNAGPGGGADLTTKEKWTLSADGKTLTIDREQNTPRGTMTSKLVLAKN